MIVIQHYSTLPLSRIQDRYDYTKPSTNARDKDLYFLRSLFKKSTNFKSTDLETLSLILESIHRRETDSIKLVRSGKGKPGAEYNSHEISSECIEEQIGYMIYLESLETNIMFLGGASYFLLLRNLFFRSINNFLWKI